MKQQNAAEQRLIEQEVERRVENELLRRFRLVVDSAEWKKELETHLDAKS